MKNYFRALDEPLDASPEFPSFAEPSRRDFLKMAGFSVAAVAAASCTRPPIEKAIPYLDAPTNIVPGRPYWLASTCDGCAARCGVLVKCCDGRPIKLDGNPDHPVSRGGLCAIGQAQVLGVYDSKRLRVPLANGKASEWASVDAAVAAKLANAKRVRVVTQTLASPTASAVIAKFLSRFEDGTHIVYDAISSSAILDAHERTHGARVLPRYRFDRADVIASFDADFLGTWISPVEFTRGWSERRNIDERKPSMSWHVQLEPRLSLTGTNADQRLRIAPHEIGVVLAHLAQRLGHAFETPLPPLPFSDKVFARIAERLENARGRSVVVCGSNRLDDQMLTNVVNDRLGNYGATVDLAAASHQAEGSDAAMAELVGENVDALFIDGNPVYELPLDFAALIKRTPLVVSFASHVDETSQLAHFVCPDHHFLEAWRDSVPVDGVLAITQPAIAPLGKTRAIVESFATWSASPRSAYDLIREGKANWEKTLSDGFAVTPNVSETSGRMGGATHAIRAALPPSPLAPLGVTLVLYPSIGMRDGRHAHNPWLHELPDPVTKITWDNVASLSPATAKKLGVKDGDVIKVNGIELPAFVQPGQHDGVIAIALGYGRLGTDRFAKIGPQWLLRRTLLAPGEPVGKRVVQLANAETIIIEKTGRSVPIATTQLHSSMEGRPIIQETTVADLANNEPRESRDNGLWPEHAKGAHQWAMAIDLTRCTGCSGCVIACQAENNVPVVGKDEVLREREMHWIRIDRYYAGSDDELEATHQPMLCHHCGNAPCESVCPVLATVHSADGLNQQVYNRCVGTRYCANNCPYKARRFNWFDYPHEDRLANLALNPDVTVRSRGVMEKCSMCVQRIEAAKIEAKRLGIPIADGAIRTACQQSCPADAIVFGDVADPKSRISAMHREKRHYLLLEELGLRPAVGYMKKVRNV